MDPTQFMLPMPSMIPPHFLHNLNIPTATTTSATVPPPVNTLPIDVLGMWANGTSPTVARAIAAAQNQKRPRSEKKPIPADLKDQKYYDRRTRNNQAAKKSRDARKAREDDIAIRANFLEKENAILRAQAATLREEAISLKMLIQKRRRT